MIVTAEELESIRRQAVEEYPNECCGVVVARAGERRLLRCRNVQNELHARDPIRHPRDAATAYYIDPADLLKVARLETEGYEVALVYHSHIDAGAYFSPTDRRQALMNGEPIYPDAAYLVASVQHGEAGVPSVAAAALFRWDATARDFVQIELPQNDEERAR